jgi:hypothetical protein
MIGSHAIEGHLTTLYYRNFPENELPLYLEVVHLRTQRRGTSAFWQSTNGIF